MIKSTELKLLVRRALAEGRSHRDVICLSLEEMRGDAHAHVVDAVESAKRMAGGGPRHILLLGEVTAVPRWQSALMSLFDLGMTDHDVVVCTGSSALLRTCEPSSRLADSFIDPDRLHVYATRGGGEIDFVCVRRAEAVAVEVKYQSSPDLRKAAAVARAFPGRPTVVVTRDLLDVRDAYTLVPASLFLWALG